MESYAQIQKFFEVHIVSQCVDVLEEMAEMSKEDASKRLEFILDIVENKVRSPLHALDEDWGAQSDLRNFAESIDDFVIYIDDKISQIYDDKKGQDDIEIGWVNDKKQVEKAIARWKWLENRYGDMAGSYPA